MNPIFAYLDPATGSALAQIGLGAAAVISLGYHFTRRHIAAIWHRIKPGSEAPADVHEG